jgi:hypothetical protein
LRSPRWRLRLKVDPIGVGRSSEQPDAAVSDAMPAWYRQRHYVERAIQYPRHRGGDSYQRILLPAVAAHLAIAVHACDLGNDVHDLCDRIAAVDLLRDHDFGMANRARQSGDGAAGVRDTVDEAAISAVRAVVQALAILKVLVYSLPLAVVEPPQSEIPGHAAALGAWPCRPDRINTLG